MVSKPRKVDSLDCCLISRQRKLIGKSVANLAKSNSSNKPVAKEQSSVATDKPGETRLNNRLMEPTGAESEMDISGDYSE